MIAAYEPRFLEPPNAPQAGRRRYSGAAGQIDVGDPAIILQFVENPAINVVKLNLLGANRKWLAITRHRGLERHAIHRTWLSCNLITYQPDTLERKAPPGYHQNWQAQAAGQG